MVETVDHLQSNLADNSELYDLSKADGDIDGLQAIQAEADALEKKVEELEFRRMFNHPADRATALSTSRPVLAAPRPATGLRCCCAST